MSDAGELAGGLGVRAILAQLDEHLQSRGVSEDTRAAVTNSFAMTWEYFTYAMSQKENPSDPKVLRAFLLTKGMNTAKYFGSDPVNCGIAIVEFLRSVIAAKKASRNIPLATIAVGLAMLDLIEVGNSCDPVQQAYYEAFLRDRGPEIQIIRSSLPTQAEPPVATPIH